ncbi:Retrovirus-related Pol polyprotein from transposo n TNT 1-94 [Trichuris trichiura]|uniref:Retrovirus-related Pol polyprotein from transposo n TNT 1-94 n=1 Tax=Trichuris trichiura TaxID=36087 RepID=A0A077ZKB1_TRITR|nr:Retrovirus-related Pol polyprotein from transposo n TNT 1-94 [Trichuris trichiura]
MSGKEVDNLQKLNGSNYHDWKLNKEWLLRKEKPWKYVDGLVKRPEQTRMNAAEVKRFDEQAEIPQTTTVLAIEPSQQQHVRDCENAQDTVKDEEAAVKFLRDKELLHSERLCPFCGKAMRLGRGGMAWCCSKRSCHRELFIRMGTWFEVRNIDAHCLLKLSPQPTEGQIRTRSFSRTKYERHNPLEQVAAADCSRIAGATGRAVEDGGCPGEAAV